MTDAARGFTLDRLFDATPEAVWRAWTDPDHAAEWWRPSGVRTPRETIEIDARVGGRFSYTMVDAATGEEYPTGGEYRELSRPSRLVFSWGDPEGDPARTFLITVSIRNAGELAKMTLDFRGADGSKGDGSYYDGWDSALDALAEHLGQTAMHG